MSVSADAYADAVLAAERELALARQAERELNQTRQKNGRWTSAKLSLSALALILLGVWAGAAGYEPLRWIFYIPAYALIGWSTVLAIRSVITVNRWAASQRRLMEVELDYQQLLSDRPAADDWF